MTGTYIKQIIILCFFTFIFGFVTWVNGTLIPYLQIVCELREWQAYLVTFAFYISYTCMALPSGKILQYTGMVKGMQTGLFIIAAGCIFFIPAALVRYYPLFLAGLFIIGAGTTLLQIAINPYITKMGDIAHATRRISIMGMFNKFSGIVAPLVLGSVILHNADGLLKELESLSPTAKNVRLNELALDIIMPYSVLTVILVLIAFFIKWMHLPEVVPPVIKLSPAEEKEWKKLIQKKGFNKAFIMGFTAIFVSVGAEVISGDTISNYGIYHGIRLDVAKSLTSYTMASLLTGYLLGILLVPKVISQKKAFLFSSLLGIFFTICIVLSPGSSSVVFVALLGLANALLWPSIWPLALRGLSGKLLNRCSAILIMGIAGGAILPLAYSWLAHITNNRLAYLILIPCYLFNIYYNILITKNKHDTPADMIYNRE